MQETPPSSLNLFPLILVVALLAGLALVAHGNAGSLLALSADSAVVEGNVFTTSCCF